MMSQNILEMRQAVRPELTPQGALSDISHWLSEIALQLALLNERQSKDASLAIAAPATATISVEPPPAKDAK